MGFGMADQELSAEYLGQYFRVHTEVQKISKISKRVLWGVVRSGCCELGWVCRVGIVGLRCRVC